MTNFKRLPGPFIGSLAGSKKKAATLDASRP
jgi:hypothetical protein